jgi:hypothetical protein
LLVISYGMEIAPNTHASLSNRPQNFQRGNQASKPHAKSPSGLRLLKGEAELAEQIAAEFDQLTAVDRILIHGAARLLIRASRTGDGEIAVRATSEARRTLESLRRRYGNAVVAAPASGPSYAELAAQAQREQSAKRPAELAADAAQTDSEIAEQSASETPGEGEQ